MPGERWDRLDAELLDVLQANAIRRGEKLRVRTAESKRSYPLPTSRATPTLACAFCGRKRCTEHDDLPALDPFFSA